MNMGGKYAIRHVIKTYGTCHSRLVRILATFNGNLRSELTAFRVRRMTSSAIRPRPYGLSPAQTARAQDNCTTVHRRRERLSMPIHQARSARLFVASIVLCSWLPAVALADEFARTHRREIQEMVAASVRMETSFNAILHEFARKARLDPDPHSASLRAEASLNHDCYNFISRSVLCKISDADR
jgi:hypothetical protein